MSVAAVCLSHVCCISAAVHRLPIDGLRYASESSHDDLVTLSLSISFVKIFFDGNGEPLTTNVSEVSSFSDISNVFVYC